MYIMVKKYLNFVIAVVFSFSLFCGLFACDTYSVLDFTCFNTEVYIAVKGKISAETENSVKDDLKSLENSLSVKGDGEISAFNSSAAGTVLPLSENAYSIALKSKELYGFTDGLFNPAVLPLLRLWKLSSDTFDNNLITITPPSGENISDVLPLCDFNKITVESGAITKSDNDACVDFGGITKGYAADTAKNILSAAGVKKGYISVGGSSIFVFETEEDLSVKHPRKSGEYIFTVDKILIKNSPLSTSGDYIKFYTDINGKRYSHIVNGFTGYPADTGIISATVIAGESAEDSIRSAYATDAISTALMLMDKEKAVSFIKEKLNGFYVFIVYEKDGVKQIISNSEKIKIIDSDYSLSLI